MFFFKLDIMQNKITKTDQTLYVNIDTHLSMNDILNFIAITITEEINRHY